MDEKAETRDRGLLRIEFILGSIASAVFIVAAIAIALYIDTFGVQLAGKQETWGQFGDFLGGVMNPIVGCLSLALLVFALHLQNELLKETRAQLALSKIELQKSSDALEAQGEAMRIQLADNWFFQLMEYRAQNKPVLEAKFGSTTEVLRKFVEGQLVSYARGDHEGKSVADALKTEFAAFLQRNETTVLPLISLDAKIFEVTDRLYPTEGGTQCRELLLSQMTFAEKYLVLLLGLGHEHSASRETLGRDLLPFLDEATKHLQGNHSNPFILAEVSEQIRKHYPPIAIITN